MSMTSVLKDRNSKTRAFFEERFPVTKGVIREINASLRDAKTIRPTEMVPYGTLGTAFDYRMRYHFALTPSEKLVANIGATFSILGGYGKDGSLVGYKMATSQSEYIIKRFFQDLDETLNWIQPVGRRIGEGEEDLLLRYCVVLALLEECARALMSPNSPLFSIDENSTTEDLLNLAESHWINDLNVLTQRMANRFDPEKYGKISLNPTFSGSRDVGGADADLILDGCLLEIKCTIKDKIEKVQVYQLLGYALLDYDNQYELEKAGFYMARQDRLFVWPIAELLERLRMKPLPALPELRQEFRETLASSKLGH